MNDHPIRRVYCFSDTYGGSDDPSRQPDADALLCTDFRSFPLEHVRREFDTYGREAVTAHLTRVIFELTDGVFTNTYMSDAVKKEFEESLTGIFINFAPRLDKVNGAPFYVATSKNIRIVTTDLAALSSVKERIETLHRLPNEQNVIHSPTEQFRSSYTPYLLHPDHGVELIEESVNLIPDESDDAWTIGYVDRFGNLITRTKNVPAKIDAIKALAGSDGMVTVTVGGVSKRAYVGTSLKDAEPGSLAIYPNGGIDILRKWVAGEDGATKLAKSAYMEFGKPVVGATIAVS